MSDGHEVPFPPDALHRDGPVGDLDDRESLLLVEDDDLDAELLVSVLSRLKGLRSPTWTVSRAPDLQTAWTLLEEDTSLDLVVLDLGLPESFGLETLRKVRAWAPGLPVVVLTGSDEDALAARALQEGAQDFVSKAELPPPGIFARILRHAVERHRLHRELDHVRAELEQQARTDALTGLLNRRGLEEDLRREIDRSRRLGERLTALLVDLDDFKTINETRGHAVGDRVLCEAADLMRRVLRPSDVLARVGGDEFLVLLPETRPGEARVIAEKLRSGLDALRLPVDGDLQRVTASFGLTTIAPGHDAGLEVLLASAGRWLRAGKRAGKNRVAGGASDPDPTGRALDALLAGRADLGILASPILDRTEQVEAWELLARLDTVGPPTDELLRTAAARGVHTAADLACLRACFEAASALPPDAVLHLNLLPSTLVQVPASDLLAMPPEGVDPRRLVLELSERELVGDPSYLLAPLRELRAAGVRLALEDVGFGNSGLEALILLAPEFVKLDSGLLEDGSDGPDPIQRQLLERLLTVCRSLGCRSLATGVGDEDTRDLALGLGADLLQGALWAPRRLTGSGAAARFAPEGTAVRAKGVPET